MTDELARTILALPMGPGARRRAGRRRGRGVRREGRGVSISVGVVGLGYWGPNLARNFGALPDSQVTWLCDGDADRVERLAASFPGARGSSSFDELLADPTSSTRS